MDIFARQGDLVINKIENATLSSPEKGEGQVLAGSKSAPHTLKGDAKIQRNGLRTTVQVFEKGARLVHDGRHKTVKLPAGFYEIGPLREAGDRAVED